MITNTHSSMVKNNIVTSYADTHPYSQNAINTGGVIFIQVVFSSITYNLFNILVFPSFCVLNCEITQNRRKVGDAVRPRWFIFAIATSNTL